MKNWKTSLTGLAVLAGGIFLTVSGQAVLGGTLIVAGLGLLGAKDHNVTGGSVSQ